MTSLPCYTHRSLTLEEARRIIHVLERAEEYRGAELSPWFPITDAPCWVWRGWVDEKGYGKTRWGDESNVRVHRLTYSLLRRPVSAQDVLDHLCRNRACVNPWHLEPIDIAENTRRGARHSGLCRNGLHAMESDNVIVRYRGGLPRYECKACKEMRR